MPSQITVLIKHHPQGGVQVGSAPMARDEYLRAFNNAIVNELPILTIEDSDGDYFSFVPSQIQGFTIVALDY